MKQLKCNYVDYSDTVVQMAVNSELSYTSSNECGNCNRVSEFKDETAEIQIFWYVDAIVQTVANSGTYPLIKVTTPISASNFKMT